MLRSIENLQNALYFISSFLWGVTLSVKGIFKTAKHRNLMGRFDKNMRSSLFSRSFIFELITLRDEYKI